MSSYIDVKFINLLSTRLPKFKRKSEYLFNFRCPHCGDSQKSQTKARGFVYKKKNDMFFKCHNCGVGQSLGNLIKFLDPNLYKEYIFERFKDGKPSKDKPEFDFTPSKELKTKTADEKSLDELESFDKLVQTHPAKQFIYKRFIPKEHWDKFFLCPKFYEWTNTIVPNKFPDLKHDHPRVVIPFYDRTGKFFAFQGRAFGKEQPKYLTIKLDENKQKVYGLDKVNFQQPIYITEGPIDSLFIDNCLAAGGADLFLKNKIPNEQITYIFDNEPRNKEIVKRMYKVIEQNFNVVIWPEDLQLKDVNDMIMSGLTKLELQDIISNNTYSKLSALTKLNYWKKTKEV